MRLDPVSPGARVRLTDAGAGAPRGAPSEDAARAQLAKLTDRMDERQEALFAEGRRGLLVVLQGRDTSGKDGTIRIFNRSHYEDVLVVRVHGLVPESVWRPRYEQINLFERILTENGVTILKFFLHISREEQRERLRARLEESRKYWKLSAGDLGERDRWDEYT